jgi:hypothetical protein
MKSESELKFNLEERGTAKKAGPGKMACRGRVENDEQAQRLNKTIRISTTSE